MSEHEIEPPKSRAYRFAAGLVGGAMLLLVTQIAALMVGADSPDMQRFVREVGMAASAILPVIALFVDLTKWPGGKP